MPEPTQKQTEDIIIRTMKDDIEGKPKPAPALPPPPVTPISQETVYKASQAPAAIPVTPPPAPKIEFRPAPAITPAPTTPNKPPILIVPPKIIPPKEIPGMPVKPLNKATSTWIKLGAIGLGVILISLLGLYGYWKIFIKSKPPATTINPPVSTTTIPTLPLAPLATSTVPVKFFSNLPNKSITIDLPARTPLALMQALESETKIEETRSSVKQIKITYKGESLAIEEFLSLFSIFTPKDFLLNYL